MKLKVFLRILIIVLVLLLIVPLVIPLNATGVDPRTLADPGGRFVEVDGLQTYVLEAGPQDGEPVLLLHGFGGSTFSWRDSFDALAAAGYRAIAFDRPGFGLTDKPLEANYSHAAQAEFTAALMDVLEIERASLVGHSAGGSVIAHFALRYPERVDKLVFAAGAVVAPGGPPSFIGSVVSFTPVSRWIQIGLRVLATPERLADIQRSAYADPAVVTPEVAAGYARFLQTPGWDAGLVGLVRDSGQNTLTRDQIAAIEAPALLVWGEADTWVPLTNGEQLRDLLPEPEWVVYPGVGHLPMEETPQQFNADVIRFLAQD